MEWYDRAININYNHKIKYSERFILFYWRKL